MRFQNYLPTIPAKIMIFPISVVLTIWQVLLVIVCHQISQCKPIMGTYKVDTVPRLPPASLIIKSKLLWISLLLVDKLYAISSCKEAKYSALYNYCFASSIHEASITSFNMTSSHLGKKINIWLGSQRSNSHPKKGPASSLAGWILKDILMQGMWSFCNDSRLKYILLSYFVIYVYTCFTTQNFQKILFRPCSTVLTDGYSSYIPGIIVDVHIDIQQKHQQIHLCLWWTDAQYHDTEKI